MTVVKKAVSFEKLVYDKLQEYRGSCITETKENMTFSATMNLMLKEGLKAKGRWTK